jgi:hypothetical protein
MDVLIQGRNILAGNNFSMGEDLYCGKGWK